MNEVLRTLRNVGIVAHINAGKTTLTERILYDSGSQPWMGEVDDGTATMDWMHEEQHRGISITAAASRVAWSEHAINLIDTPGHVDFAGEVGRTLRVMDGVVVVLDGIRGVEPQTGAVWAGALQWHLPRVVFVNKLDRPASDFAAAVDSIRDRLEAKPVPVVVPVLREDRWVGLLDAVTGEVRGRAPGAAVEATGEERLRARAAVVEAVAEFDEDVLAAFVHGDEVPEETLTTALRSAAIAGELVPVLGGSALENVGVDLLLDAVCRYLPSPPDLAPARVERAARSGAAAEPAPDPGAPACALVFKVQDDEGERLNYVRVWSGTLRPGDPLACAGRGLEVPVEGLWLMRAMEREPLDAATAGDVVALTTPAHLVTGDTLHAPGAPVQLEPVPFPRPVLTAVLEPESSEQRDEMVATARGLVEEDPTLELRVDEDGEVVVAAMGELHLEVFQSRLQSALGFPVRLHRPTVAHLETVAAAGSGRVECRGLVGGRDRRVVAAVEVRPTPGAGARIRPLGPAGGRDGLPLDAVAEALEAARVSGLRGVNPPHEVEVALLELDGDAPLPDGEGLYLQAVSLALRKAVAAAQPVLLEPVLRFEITCPGDVLAGVLADLGSRRVRLDGVASGMLGARVTGSIPLAEVLGYTTRLRSLTRGQGSVHLAPDRFSPVDQDAGTESRADRDAP